MSRWPRGPQPMPESNSRPDTWPPPTPLRQARNPPPTPMTTPQRQGNRPHEFFRSEGVLSSKPLDASEYPRHLQRNRRLQNARTGLIPRQHFRHTTPAPASGGAPRRHLAVRSPCLPSSSSLPIYMHVARMPSCALDQGNRFNVIGVREHVHGLHRTHLEVELPQKRQVTHLRFRIARDVDDARGGQLHRGAQEFLA